jgi:hypothetical protein
MQDKVLRPVNDEMLNDHFVTAEKEVCNLHLHGKNDVPCEQHEDTWGTGGIPPPILIAVSRWWQVFSFTPRLS